MLAHAIPTPVMLPYKKYLLLTNETLIKPTAPAKRQMLWVSLLPNLLAMAGE